MICQLNRYPAYRDSGLPWLGSVPAHWALRRAKYFYREVDERSTTGDEELLSVSHLTGVTPRREKNVTMFLAESNVGHKRCQPHDLVINTMWAWMAALGVSRQTGLVSPSYGVYRPLQSSPILPDYADRLLRTTAYATEFACRSTGVNSSRLRLYPEVFLRIPILCPPPAEQTSIVRYLDYVDRRIRVYVRAEQKRIALLEEQGQVLIHYAVTGQIMVSTGKPYPIYKNSSIVWLEQIPEHWPVRRIKDLALLKSGDGITSADIDPAGQYPVYGGNGVRGCASRYTHDGEFVLVGRQGALCGNINYARGRFWASEHAVVAHPRCEFDVVWFGELLRTMNLNQYSLAAAQPGLAVERLQDLPLPVPPLGEQLRIGEYLRSETTKQAERIARIRRMVNLVREYRARLIGDVVTGKLDVRDAAEPLPNEIDEELALDDSESLVEDEESGEGPSETALEEVGDEP